LGNTLNNIETLLFTAGNTQSNNNAAVHGGNNNNNGSNTSATTLKNSSNASILNLLNSAPAAMTSTPVASGTFTTSTGQQQPQTLTLVQHQQQSTPTTADAATATYVQTTRGTPTLVSAQRKQQSSEVLQNLLNANRKIGGGGTTTTTFRTNSAGNLIAVNLNQAGQSHHQQTVDGGQTVRVSMSALASQLASPPAVMTNPTTSYTVISSGNSAGAAAAWIQSPTGPVQQRILSSLRRDSTTAPPNAIVVTTIRPYIQILQ